MATESEALERPPETVGADANSIRSCPRIGSHTPATTSRHRISCPSRWSEVCGGQWMCEEDEDYAGRSLQRRSPASFKARVGFSVVVPP